MTEIAARLDLQGLSYERFPAYDGREIAEEFIATRYPQYLEVFKSGAPLGELGCFISHVEAARLMLERGLTRACIVEDDAEFDSDFHRFVDDKTQFPSWAEAIKLESCVKRKFVQCCHVGAAAGRRLAYVPGNNEPGAACYILTKAGAEKVVNVASKLKDPIDLVIFDHTISSIKSIHVLPYPARQLRKMSMPSAIRASNTLPKKKVRNTMRQVLKIRTRRSREVAKAWAAAWHVIGVRTLLISFAKNQTKELRLHS